MGLDFAVKLLILLSLNVIFPMASDDYDSSPFPFDG